jgi:ketosteroid isomerase-like protein
MRAIALLIPGLLAAPQAFGQTAAECEVWNRELSFARAVADHDAAAFVEHLLDDSVFIGGNDRPAAGRDAIAAEWKGLIAGEGIALRWYPEHVHVAGDGRVALSRGPYWMETTGRDGQPQVLAGRFISTWLRGDGGTWHVAFDGGGGNVPKPVDAAEAERLRAGRKGCTPD